MLGSSYLYPCLFVCCLCYHGTVAFQVPVASRAGTVFSTVEFRSHGERRVTALPMKPSQGASDSDGHPKDSGNNANRYRSGREAGTTGTGRNRWDALDSKIKQRLIEKGQAKAIARKSRRESHHVKKKRMLDDYSNFEEEERQASRVERPLGFHERAPLSAFVPGMEVTGTVISLTHFGAYVDVGTECDGLLHISQITRDYFVEHPRQVFTPGDEISVRVHAVNPEMRKLQLTMLKVEREQDKDDDLIPLEEIEQDDELWGELRRVTDYGAYVALGAEVDGFLHFMDHPSWDYGRRPHEFMETGQRVRVWVLDVDRKARRVKLTAMRPRHLPGPRIE